MGQTTTPPKRGRPSVYGPKVATRTNVLTSLGAELQAAAAARSGATESNVIEHLLRVHAHEVTAETFAQDDAQ